MREGQMGSTQAGADWCIKALHPSDPLTQVRGIPDQSAATSLCMNYQTVATISPHSGATGTWSFDATVLPHPIDFLSISWTDTVGADTTNVLNSQLAGTTHQAKLNWLVANAQQWRLAYMGVTIVQDGPDLANQGTIVVSQPVIRPYRHFMTFSQTPDYIALPCIETYTAEDLPNFTTSQAMPSAYFGAGKLGAYIPLKLSRTAQRWSGQDTLVCPGLPANIQLTAIQDMAYLLPKATGYAWPHWDVPCAHTTSTGTSMECYPTSNLLSDVVGHISARNLAVTTSYTFFVRMGLEMRVAPSSTLSPNLELAPRCDPLALESYFAISRELKDAYPASYNDFNKLWGVISSAAKDILPYLSLFGPTGKASATLAASAVKQVDKLVARRKRKQLKKKPTPKKASTFSPPRKPLPTPPQRTTTT
jgi:hypothetical protein